MIQHLIHFTRTAQTVVDSKSLNIPQKGLTSVTVDNIMKIVFGTLGAIALIIIIIAGIKFMTSQGNPLLRREIL